MKLIAEVSDYLQQRRAEDSSTSTLLKEFDEEMGILLCEMKILSQSIILDTLLLKSDGAVVKKYLQQ